MIRASLLVIVAACGARVAAPVPPPAPVCDRADAVVSPSFTIGNGDKVCDLPDRIIIVGSQMTVRTRVVGASWPIDHIEHVGNRCDGPGGGRAGCSIAYDRYWSVALGLDHYLEFGNNAGNALVDDQGNATSCREDDSLGVIATCSTATHFLLVRFTEDGAGCWRVGGRLWEGAAESPVELTGDVDRAASSGDRWVYRFPATAARPAIALTLDRSARAATLDVGNDRESCVAFRP